MCDSLINGFVVDRMKKRRTGIEQQISLLVNGSGGNLDKYMMREASLKEEVHVAKRYEYE